MVCGFVENHGNPKTNASFFADDCNAYLKRNALR